MIRNHFCPRGLYCCHPIPFSEGVALAVMNVDSDDDVGVLTTGTFDDGGASVTGGHAADEDEARPRGRKGKGACRWGGCWVLAS